MRESSSTFSLFALIWSGAVSRSTEPVVRAEELRTGADSLAADDRSGYLSQLAGG